MAICAELVAVYCNNASMLLNRGTRHTITKSLLLLCGSNGNSHSEIAITQKKISGNGHYVKWLTSWLQDDPDTAVAQSVTTNMHGICLVFSDCGIN